MKTISVVLTTDDKELAERISDLESRCKSIGDRMPFESLMQISAGMIPPSSLKIVIDVLLMYAEKEMLELEHQKRIEDLFNKCFGKKGK